MTPGARALARERQRPTFRAGTLPFVCLWPTQSYSIAFVPPSGDHLLIPTSINPCYEQYWLTSVSAGDDRASREPSKRQTHRKVRTQSHGSTARKSHDCQATEMREDHDVPHPSTPHPLPPSRARRTARGPCAPRCQPPSYSPSASFIAERTQQGTALPSEHPSWPFHDAGLLGVIPRGGFCRGAGLLRSASIGQSIGARGYRRVASGCLLVTGPRSPHQAPAEHSP